MVASNGHESMMYSNDGRDQHYALGHFNASMLVVTCLRRPAFGHISKQGSLRVISSSGTGGRTPNLNCLHIIR